MADAETEKKIVQLLSTRFNKWWNGGKIVVPQFRRRDFKYVSDKLGEPRAITLIGPRQIGKTTLVMQLIYELIETRKIAPKQVLYVQLDDVELRLACPKNLLTEILSVYQKYVLLEDLNTTQNDIYLFLDEVQRVEDWAEHVKALLAANKHLHILATGSASFIISQKSKETLPGRHELFCMYPLKFADALSLRQTTYGGKLDLVRLTTFSYGLRAKFEEALVKKSFGGFFGYAKEKYMEMATMETELTAGLIHYFSKGGYPEIITTADVSTCQKLLRSYANDVIVKDLMPWFGIRDFSTAEKLLYLLASISGEELNASALLKRISGSNSMTVNKYIDYLASLGIISLVQVHSGSKLGSTKHPKIYFGDIGLRNAQMGLLDAPMERIDLGHIAETVSYDHLMRLAYKLNSSAPGHIFCFRGKRGDVDFILDLPRHSIKLPVEIKFRKTPTDIRGIYEFLETSNYKLAVIVTENTLELKEDILYLPLWMFLLMC
ncbi:MAG: ATP-binding protein [Candidatus Burarchaeum sp.]|nr:ATP-binding protein [Candidatus Burarchaeum sp.]MDO8340215.1 ATP-binding protein [Candidatus Burarchaeum sp.]